MARTRRAAGYVIVSLLGLAVMLVLAERLGWPAWIEWVLAVLGALLLFNAGAALVLRKARREPPASGPST